MWGQLLGEAGLVAAAPLGRLQQLMVQGPGQTWSWLLIMVAVVAVD